MASWILPKNEHWGNFQYLHKITTAFVFWKNPGQHIFFRDFLTCSGIKSPYFFGFDFFLKARAEIQKYFDAKEKTLKSPLNY
jgi:hypothetical protein